MRCDKCGYEVPEGSKFCPECGAKVEIKEPEITLTLDPEMPGVNQEFVETVQEVKPEPEIPSVSAIKEWYFVEDNQSKGTYSEEEMKMYLNNGRINHNTFVWKNGMDEWKPLKDTTLVLLGSGASPVVEKKEPVQDNVEWYYIAANSSQNGPFNKAQMIDFVKNGTVTQNTYVWCTGMADWVFAKNSELSSYFQSAAQDAMFTAAASSKTTSRLGLVKRNIGMSILLSIVTCGIYSFYWLYTLAEDVNKITDRYGDNTQHTSGGMVILLSIVTCGIYELYWIYKCGKRLAQCQLPNGFRVTDDSIIMLVLAIFGLSIVSFCILQSTINDVVTYGE